MRRITTTIIPTRRATPTNKLEYCGINNNNTDKIINAMIAIATTRLNGSMLGDVVCQEILVGFEAKLLVNG
jgi:hypothetical protein